MTRTGTTTGGAPRRRRRPAALLLAASACPGLASASAAPAGDAVDVEHGMRRRRDEERGIVEG